ncbi:hypothetical protein COO60DRAFT_337570 [Scenedesmus sp. NREL 46B-D3]|nr:hypothetical protein COO60DRAFT_337570 [Scenedesmus sp. NREL 46B-D3]
MASEFSQQHTLRQSLQPACQDSVFFAGWQVPWRSCSRGGPAVPWETVQELLLMARDALIAKQRAAEALLKEVDLVKQAPQDDKLLQRAQRAEVDSGVLLEELQALIQAKSDVAQQRADLDRANALLMAERELLCEQLDVSPDNVNLCQAVQRVLAAARRTRGVETQLRLLARQQRDTLLQLEAAREAEARSARHWQACEQAYLETLAAHGVTPPQLPQSPAKPSSGSSISDTGSIDVFGSGGSGSSAGGSSAGSAAAYSHLLQRLGGVCSGAGAGVGGLEFVGSPAGSHAQLLPPTPPASDLNAAAAEIPQRIRRSHSLDSGLNSLTGLLDQLALGQVCSEEGASCEYDDYCESESWMLLEQLSEETMTSGSSSKGGAGSGSAGGEAAKAAAALLMLGGGAAGGGSGHHTAASSSSSSTTTCSPCRRVVRRQMQQRCRCFASPLPIEHLAAAACCACTYSQCC